MSLAKTFALTTGCAALMAAPAGAGERLHRRAHHASGVHGDPSRGFAARGGYPQTYGGPRWEAQGGAVAAATARAQTEPGVSQELVPFAQQSATGGPSGGPSGFSGGM